MKSKTQKIVLASMLAALTCIATMIIKIPSPMKGYINLGDCVVLVCGWILSPFYGFLAAGLGSALADIFSGYIVYAPATFVIKGLMALVAYFVCKNKKNTLTRIIGGISSEIVMILGYFSFEGFLYGFSASLLNMPANITQGVAGLILGVVIIKLIEKSKKI